MIEYKNKQYVCVLDASFSVIRGKWKTLILCHLSEGDKRFLELQRKIPGISHKVLIENLNELEDENIIMKETFPEVPPKVEYSLTTKGIELMPALNIIKAWGNKYILKETD